MESIVLGGGCFWCLDASYKIVKGVTKVEEGYAGGSVPNPTDKQVYYEDTGHAEVVRVSYHPEAISLADILEIFWTIHDPTTLNRQGIDIGREYRSVIFYSDDNQKAIIEASKKKAQQVWNDPIVTEISPLEQFYPAAAYQQDYAVNRPDYCQIIINPKLSKLRQKFADKIV